MQSRVLGRTGRKVSIFGLGGEGVLRTTGRLEEAQAVIKEAIKQGVNYFDTAPAYAASRDYLGSVFGSIGAKRKELFIASKTHARDYAGTLRLLDDTLRRLRVDYLDLLQLHDLRTMNDLDDIFAKGGAIEALKEAQAKGLIKFVGITGHHDPQVLMEAINRHQFDTVLLCCNVADAHYEPFITTVIPAARKRGMGVIAMKVMGAGQLLDAFSQKECLGYAWSQDVDLAIVGCATPEEVHQNAGLARDFKQLSGQELRALEERAKPVSRVGNFFKRGMY